MSKRRTKRFPQEFKDRAVELRESSDLPVTEIAAQLDVNPKNLYNWRSKAETIRSGTKQSESAVLKRENKLLRKELARLKEEQVILKKAAAYFARDIQ